jgi:DNA primase
VIPDEEVERVREAADIVAIVSEFVALKRVGGTYRGACPFHQGTHRNFSVEPRRKIFHCFVCGEGGDAFTFLQKRLGLDWPSAVRMVAQKSGIELREVRPGREGPDLREPLWEVNAAAQEYFSRFLWNEPNAASARAYLAGRDIGPETADRFGLGLAPREIGLLRSHMGQLGIDENRLLAAGLFVRREEGEDARPRFRGRLMFPIYDAAGHVAGFGGRLLGPGEPKYLNSPETIAFTKGKLLYGLNWARTAIRRAERVLLVEGYFDLVRLAVAGVEEVVAPLGTALTPDQAELIARYSRNVFLLYDSDKAGLKATFRAGDELLRHGVAVRVVSFPEGEDPDTFVQAGGRDALERQISQSVDVFERKIQLLQRGGWFTDLHRRRRAIDHLLPTIRAAHDPLTRDMYIGRAAEASGLDRHVLNLETAHGESVRAPGDVRVRADGASRTRRTIRAPLEQRAARAASRAAAGLAAERELVRVMLALRSTVERIGERIGPGQFRDSRYREIFEVLLRLGHEATHEAIAADLAPEAAEAMAALMGHLDAVQDVDRFIAQCLGKLEERSLKDRNAEIQRLLTAATDSEKDTLMAEKQANSDSIRRLTDERHAT